MVRSEKFTKLISLIVGTDLDGVISFLRSEGVNVSLSATPKDVTSILIYSLAKSEVLKNNFIAWGESRYENESNYSGEMNANGGFDTMATQGNGKEFDAMSSQQGTNVNANGFANASGEFNTMDTQSGGFSPMESQNVNFFGGNDEKSYIPYDPNVEGSGSKIGNALRSDTFKSVLDKGLEFWKDDTAFKQQKAIANAGLEAERLKLEQLKEQGKITQQQFEAQLKLAQQQSEAPKSTVIFWVIGGVVLLGALGTTIYFATRKK